MQPFLEIDNLIAFGIVSLRMLGCFVFNPLLGRRNVPVIVFVGMSLLMALLVYNYSDMSTIGSIETAAEYIVIGAKELCIGFVVGFVVSLFLYIIILGGEVMDMQIGLAMAKVYDPNSNVSMSLTATVYNILFIFTFFAVNGHITLLKLFLELEKVIPYGQALYSGELGTAVISVFCHCTVLGLKLAMPMVGLQFLMEIGVGILMKNIPQINVIMVNIQAKILVGLVFMVVIFAPAMSFVEYIIEEMFGAISQLVGLMG